VLDRQVRKGDDLAQIGPSEIGKISDEFAGYCPALAHFIELGLDTLGVFVGRLDPASPELQCSGYGSQLGAGYFHHNVLELFALLGCDAFRHNLRSSGMRD
jgi:hypothetical protein